MLYIQYDDPSPNFINIRLSYGGISSKQFSDGVSFDGRFRVAYFIPMMNTTWRTVELCGWLFVYGEQSQAYKVEALRWPKTMN